LQSDRIRFDHLTYRRSGFQSLLAVHLTTTSPCSRN
jgi:hypothetical protein